MSCHHLFAKREVGRAEYSVSKRESAGTAAGDKA